MSLTLLDPGTNGRCVSLALLQQSTSTLVALTDLPVDDDAHSIMAVLFGISVISVQLLLSKSRLALF